MRVMGTRGWRMLRCAWCCVFPFDLSVLAVHRAGSYGVWRLIGYLQLFPCHLRVRKRTGVTIAMSSGQPHDFNEFEYQSLKFRMDYVLKKSRKNVGLWLISITKYNCILYIEPSAMPTIRSDGTCKKKVKKENAQQNTTPDCIPLRREKRGKICKLHHLIQVNGIRHSLLGNCESPSNNLIRSSLQQSRSVLTINHSTS